MKYKDLSGFYHRDRLARAGRDRWFIEAIKLKDLYLDTGLWRVNNKEFVKICQIIDRFEWGAVSENDISFIKSKYEQFGPDSSFWHEYTTTRRERVMYRKRVMNILHYATIRKRKKAAPTRGELGKLNKIAPIDGIVMPWVDKLRVFPLTRKEKQLVWSLERALGIWYDDLSDEEQGIFVGRK